MKNKIERICRETALFAGGGLYWWHDGQEMDRHVGSKAGCQRGQAR